MPVLRAKLALVALLLVAARPERVAVLHLQGEGFDPSTREYLSEVARGEVARLRPALQVITPENVAQMVEEAGGSLLASDLAEGAPDAGRRLGAVLVVTGKIYRWGSGCRILLQLYDTHSGSLLASATEPAAGGEALEVAVRRAVARLFLDAAAATASSSGTMVAIPPGRSPEGRATPGFWIDRTEVTGDDYRRYLAHAGGPSPRCPYPWRGEESGQEPVVCVTWWAAHDYCAWRGARLPTRAEWERAACADAGTAYPWGDAPPDCGRTVMRDGEAGCGSQGALPVGSRPADRSCHGVLDLVGNVVEWVAPAGERTPGLFAPVQGGGWNLAHPPPLQGADPVLLPARRRAPDLGFRCARSRAP